MDCVHTPPVRTPSHRCADSPNGGLACGGGGGEPLTVAPTEDLPAAIDIPAADALAAGVPPSQPTAAVSRLYDCPRPC